MRWISLFEILMRWCQLLSLSWVGEKWEWWVRKKKQRNWKRETDKETQVHKKDGWHRGRVYMCKPWLVLSKKKFLSRMPYKLLCANCKLKSQQANKIFGRGKGDSHKEVWKNTKVTRGWAPEQVMKGSRKGKSVCVLCVCVCVCVCVCRRGGLIGIIWISAKTNVINWCFPGPWKEGPCLLSGEGLSSLCICARRRECECHFQVEHHRSPNERWGLPQNQPRGQGGAATLP